MIATIDIEPIPAIIPVSSRVILLLSLLKNAWVQPSMTVGSNKASVNQIFKVNK